ncbi:tRNA dimethylallyltransferase 9 [Vitis vinifera]|uniref:tRNA dimethylallyltransferase 9 n=1 Tax=Vitis vinifera TaxID=29760 RepID=A0A438E5C6_VITVI|nr:tRNA dimethylallyltransferase 9 [Vitis vinifera]
MCFYQGKSPLERYGWYGVIIKVYRGLDVGSAKPSLMDRKEVPHHLVDILHPSEGILLPDQYTLKA